MSVRRSEASRWGERFTDRELMILYESLRRRAVGLQAEISLELRRRGYVWNTLMGWISREADRV